MSQFLLKYLTGKRVALIICSSVIILIGVLITASLAPTLTSGYNLDAAECLDYSNSSNKWFYPKGIGSCNTADTLGKEKEEVVYAFQLPLSENNSELGFSRWQQHLEGMGILQVDTALRPAVLTIDARLAYRNKGDPDDAWQLYASAVEERVFHSNEEQIFQFTLSSLHHDYYLLNIRIPEIKVNKVKHMWMMVINQNGDITKIWASLKTGFFSLTINLIVLFWRRKCLVPRPLTLLEYMLLLLGAAAAFLNMPLEYFALVLPIPFMLLLNDIRQGIFYAMLLFFWIVFAGELLKIHDRTPSQSTLRCYWKHLSAVAIGCLSVLIFDMYEHGNQLHNPFSSDETNLPLMFNIVAAIFACIYFFFLCFMIWKVFRKLTIKEAVQPNMSLAQLLLLRRFFYRLKFFMLVTVLCAAMTVIEFIVDRTLEGYGNLQMRHMSAPFMVVYSIWNIYTFVVLILCIPIPVNVESNIIVTYVG